MGSFSMIHWIIVLLIVIMVFGTKKLKNLGTDLGGAVKGFKEGMNGAHESTEKDAGSILDIKKRLTHNNNLRSSYSKRSSH